MSMRSDFLGELQKDEPLYSVHQQINVPPMRRDALLELVSQPAELLSARFETAHPCRRHRKPRSRRVQQGSLAFCHFCPTSWMTCGDTWSIVATERFACRLSRLTSGACSSIGQTRSSTPIRIRRIKLRRILTLKLATVRENGEPTRRRAWRSEFSEEEWRLINELADHPNRLITTVTQEILSATLVPQSNLGRRETYAEVAHEAIFQRWDKLRGWIAAEREFLVWRSVLEIDRHGWKPHPMTPRTTRC